MSRSNPEVRLESPCTRYFQWSGDEGGFKYYNKETKENIKVPLPFTFIVLDCLNTIGGFSDAHKSSFWSNETKKKEIKSAMFKVKNSNGPVCEGTWDQIKGKESGMKFCESVYIAYANDNKQLVIGNIKMIGSALSAWINYCAGEKDEKGKRISDPHDPFSGAITVNKMIEGKKGKTIFQIPVFEPKELSASSNETASELDKILQEYLTKYFAKNAAEANVDPPSEQEVEETFTNRDSSAKEVAVATQAEASNGVIDQLPF